MDIHYNWIHVRTDTAAEHGGTRRAILILFGSYSSMTLHCLDSGDFATSARAPDEKPEPSRAPAKSGALKNFLLFHFTCHARISLHVTVQGNLHLPDGQADSIVTLSYMPFTAWTNARM